MSGSKLSRRKVLKYAAAGAAGGIALPYFIPSGVLAADGKPGANDRVVIGFIGCGGRAQQLMSQMPAGGQIVAIAVCNLKRPEEYVAKQKNDWKVYQDFRKMLDTEKLDAVFIATPDHVRTGIAVQCCQAGKDIYAEKPLTAYIGEGRVLVNTARKHKTVFQVGTQQRTMEMNRFACEFVRKGGLGKLKYVQGMCYTGPKRFPGLPEEPVPEKDDYNVWLGPTPFRPFNHDIQFGWHQWRDYSGGEMTNWGAHGLDQIQWAMGMSDSGPVEIWPVSEGPNGKVSMRYANGVEVRFEIEMGQGRGPMGRDLRRRKRQDRNQPQQVHHLSQGSRQGRPVAGRGEKVGRRRLDRPAPYPELFGLHQDARAPQCRRRNRPPLGQPLPLGQHRPRNGPQAPLGSGEGGIH